MASIDYKDRNNKVAKIVHIGLALKNGFNDKGNTRSIRHASFLLMEESILFTGINKSHGQTL